MIAAIVQRLETEATALGAVKTAEDLEALSKGTAPRGGDAFVLPFEDKAEANIYGMGAFHQEVATLFLVAVVIRRHGDAKGTARAGSFDTWRDAIETALAGWSPGDGSAPCELVAARAASMGNGVTVYVQTWKTSRSIRA